MDLIEAAKKKRRQMDRASKVLPVAEKVYDMLAVRFLAAPATLKKALPGIAEILQALEDILKDKEA